MASDQGVRVGRIMGAPVLLKRSWFVVAVLITVLYVPHVRQRLPELRAGAYAVAFAFAALLLVSVLLHEVAHTLAARATGQAVTRVVLDVWGGHTVFTHESSGPGRSALVAVVGPLSNAVLTVAAWSCLPVVHHDGILRVLLEATAVANLVVAVLNSLPGLPLDGGRLVEAAVWWIRADRLAGTLVAGWCGRLVTVGLVAWFVAVPAALGRPPAVATVLWLLVVAGLLWQGATQAIRHARWHRLLPDITVRSLLRPAVTVGASVSLAEALRTAREAEVREIVVVDPPGSPVAVVDPATARSVPAGRRTTTSVMAVAESLPRGATVPVDYGGQDLLTHMQDHLAPRYAVREHEGAIVGVLAWNDVTSALGSR